jgi:hypothetical protein
MYATMPPRWRHETCKGKHGIVSHRSAVGQATPTTPCVYPAKVTLPKGIQMHATTLVRRILRTSFLVAGMALVFVTTAGKAHAFGPNDAPEIDAASITGALTLLTGGLLVLQSRLRRPSGDR